MNKKNKHIHFIGIGGTAMASIAVAFRHAGFKITGSEPHEIFPPMSDYLKKNKIKYYFPFDPKKIGKPNEIIVGNAHYSDENVEVKYARENNIELEHFPRLLEKYFIKKNSIVIAGTYAKTTITAMVAWLFEAAEKNPSYMLGGIPLNFNHGARLSSINFKPSLKDIWSIAEGDEYPAASPWDYSSKFDFYHPKYLILSSTEWDHFDIFKTKRDYINSFINLVKSIPKDGLIVAKSGGENISGVLKKLKCKIVYYSGEKRKEKREKKIINSKKDLYYIDDIKYKDGITKFSVFKNDRLVGNFETSLIGDFNLENWCAAIALANELKLDLKKIQAGVKSFIGVKRRLEIRFPTHFKLQTHFSGGLENFKPTLEEVFEKTLTICPPVRREVGKKIIIIDDFAHSPSKARGSAQALAKYFHGSRIFVVFEPNRGGRALKCMKNYYNIFSNIYKIFIPKLSQYKKKPGVYDVSGKELAMHLKKSHKNIVYQPDNQKILKSIIKSVRSGDVVAFMGSRNFDILIKDLFRKLKLC